MAPAAKTKTSTLQAALELLAECEDICRRTSIRYGAHHSHEGPMAVLLRQQTKTLEAELHCLTARISGSKPKPDSEDSEVNAVSPEALRALNSTKLRLFELLDLQHFHSREEQEDHDGALNALFARTFILSDCACPDAARASGCCDEDKLTRIGLELKDLLHQVFPADVCRGTFSQDEIGHWLSASG
jgi:hypothetical protein